jgi:hypothetical protein
MYPTQNNNNNKKGNVVFNTMEFYSVLKKHEILSFEGTWLELEKIISSEDSQAKKTKDNMISLICGI